MNDSISEIIIVGLILILLFTVIGILYGWLDNKVKLELIDNYKNHEYFKLLKLQIQNGGIITGDLGDYPFELAFNVYETNVDFSLKLDLSNRPHFNNSSNIKRALKGQKFELEGNIIIISNWKPRINTYLKFDLIIIKIQELINRIEK